MKISTFSIKNAQIIFLVFLCSRYELCLRSRVIAHDLFEFWSSK